MKLNRFKSAAIAALALAGVAFTFAPTTAKAGPDCSRYSHRCGSCSTPVYQRQVIVGYTRCGDPIFRWVTSSHRCSGPSHRSHGHGHHSRQVHPHDVISGIVSGIIHAHRDHRGHHFGHRGH